MFLLFEDEFGALKKKDNTVDRNQLDYLEKDYNERSILLLKPKSLKSNFSFNTVNDTTLEPDQKTKETWSQKTSHSTPTITTDRIFQQHP